MNEHSMITPTMRHSRRDDAGVGGVAVDVAVAVAVAVEEERDDGTRYDTCLPFPDAAAVYIFFFFFFFLNKINKQTTT
jgi:hypothetical protein